MSIPVKIFLLALSAFFVGFAIYFNQILSHVPEKPILEETWWGPDSEKALENDTSIKPFKISIPNEVIEDLKRRINQVRPFTPPLEGVQQQYGMNTNLLKEFIEFWNTKYDWKERQEYLNKYPQFTTKIQGLNIHFIRVKPSNVTNQRVLPLLILHGWGGSIREFYDLIPLLTTPQSGRKFVFEVIVPSLPGFAFSQAASKPGLGVAHMAVIFKNLMKRLGYEKYYLQGGDWGGVITSIMAALYPEHVLGLHSNMCVVNTPKANAKLLIGSLIPSLFVEEEYQDRLYPLSGTFSSIMEESGYFHMHATKPDTLGVALQDSPVGFAAYMLEKFITWTNPNFNKMTNGGILQKYSYTQLLDNIMIYWLTNSITTSMRIYAESVSIAHRKLKAERVPIEVPTACAKFRHEVFYFPDSLLKEKFKQLVQSNHFKTGGHFAAFEEPVLLAKDIWQAVRKFERIIHANKDI